MQTRTGLTRYTDGDRINHWLVVLCFFVAGATGLAFFHPSMYWMAELLGGGPWARIIHPFAGVLMIFFFVGMFFRFWRHNIIEKADREWLGKWRDVMNNREEAVPEVGRYNGGQKVLFWVMVICLIVLLLTGITFWRPYFRESFSVEVIRVATLLHSVSAVVLIAGIIVHIYAAIWVKGTLQSMTIGTVARNWARKHHARWFRDETAENRR
jgi:formate dehydrogenase subunit gamma